MKKTETVYREILYQAIEKENRSLTQAALARKLKISLSTVNLAITPLARTGAVTVKKRGLDIREPRKILYHWASARNLGKDVIYQTRVNVPVREIEKNMPDDAIYTAYSAYKLKFKEVPADYSEAYVYGEESIKRLFPQSKGIPNLFVLRKDAAIESYGKVVTLASIFVDLWNIREWYAGDFLKALEGKIGRILE